MSETELRSSPWSSIYEDRRSEQRDEEVVHVRICKHRNRHCVGGGDGEDSDLSLQSFGASVAVNISIAAIRLFPAGIHCVPL